MRELFRQMAKHRMAQMGYNKINRRMRRAQWRRVANAYPVNVDTGIRMPEGHVGRSRYNRRYGKAPQYFYFCR